MLDLAYNLYFGIFYELTPNVVRVFIFYTFLPQIRQGDANYRNDEKY